MSERTRGARIEEYYERSARDLAETLVDAEDEAARLRSAWKSARRRAKTAMGAFRYENWRREAQSKEMREQDEFARTLWGTVTSRSAESRRYRSAWLSARRRAADEYNHGVEAADLIHARAARRVQRGDDFADEMTRATTRGEWVSREFLIAALDELNAAVREERAYIPLETRKCTYAAPAAGDVVWRLEGGRLVAYPTVES